MATLRRRAAPVAILASRSWRASGGWGMRTSGDEALAAWAVRKGLAGVTLWTASDVHPPSTFGPCGPGCRRSARVRPRPAPPLRPLGVLTVAAVYRPGAPPGRAVGGGAVGALVAVRGSTWWSQETHAVLAGPGALSLLTFLRWLRAHRRGSPGRPSGGSWSPTCWPPPGRCTRCSSWGARRRGRTPSSRGAPPCRGTGGAAPLGGWVAAQLAVAAPVAGWLALSWGRMQSWSVAEPVSPGFVARLYATLSPRGSPRTSRR